MAAVKRNRLGDLVLVLVLFLILLGSLVVMSDAAENSEQFGRLYSWLLLFNAVGLLLLTSLIGYQVFRLVQQYRAREAGARLTLRLVTMFVLLSIAPVSVVYYFSLQFLQSGIDSWFDVRVEDALEDALELSRASLDLRMREALKQTESMSEQLAFVSPGLEALTLSELRAGADADEITLLQSTGRIIASASVDAAIVPDRPDESVLQQVRQGNSYVGLSPADHGNLQIRALAIIPSTGAALAEDRVVQVLFPVADRFSALADSVQDAFDSYRQLAYLRGPLKISFILTLSLVLAVSLLTSVWAAMHSARRLVAPVRDLAEGTLAVSKGRYDQRLPVPGNDELGFLVMSFNQMTGHLAYARDQANRSQRLLERQRAYLETVLSGISSGVLTLRHDGRLRTANAAAGHILGLVPEEVLDRKSEDVAATRPYLTPFFEAVSQHITAGEDEWTEQVDLFGSGGRQVLMCRGSVVTDDRGQRGHVVVFDDITALVRAQRNAAWAEVARRLAHEIKNPLTPIQLAAERVRHKYLKEMDAETGNVLDRATHTIIQQVEALKELVNAFNEYARPPRLYLRRLQLNALLSEVLDLYKTNPFGVKVLVRLDPSNPTIEADAGRIRQLLHNLVKNALEAMDGIGGELRVSTNVRNHDGNRYVDLVLEDDGPGFPSDAGVDIFEPYVTTKPKGTGLGLAIVKNIVEEHGGLIQAEAPASGGARIVIRFPPDDLAKPSAA